MPLAELVKSIGQKCVAGWHRVGPWSGSPGAEFTNGFSQVTARRRHCRRV